jgi:oligopeptide/dipeptide ABC transporter ATP-binding protein
MNSILDIHNLSVDYLTPRGELKALRDVSIAIPKGQVVGLVGESGCGKSTLIAAIINLLASNARIRSGGVQFKGAELLELSQAEMLKVRGEQISMIFQDPMTTLNPALTVGEQMVDIQYRRKGSRKDKLKIAASMLERVGIPDPESRLSRYAHQFSGGMCQRIAIAMALLMEPDLLIADEPTTALDATLEVQIIHRLRELQERLGCSILFISHHLGVIAELCDYVVVMYAGEVVEQGTVRDIFHRPQHPYTRKLLECDPATLRETTRQLPTIPGNVPDLVRVPQGCIFAERCEYASALCRERRPDNHSLTDQHSARCHLLAKEPNL